MPALHVAALFLAFLQWSFFLKSFDFLSKWLKLINRAVKDAVGFMLLFYMILVVFMFAFRALGTGFDDGNNFELGEDGYDSNHDDYILVNSWVVGLVSMIRNSIGDLVPPNYLYWQEMYGQNQPVASFYIYSTWFLYGLQIQVYLIFLLNFLIAIVSDSQASIVEQEQMTILQGREEQNHEFFMEHLTEADYNQSIEAIVFATKLDDSADGEWVGITQTIKKFIRKVDEGNKARLESAVKSIQKGMSKMKNDIQRDSQERNEALKNELIQALKGEVNLTVVNKNSSVGQTNVRKSTTDLDYSLEKAQSAVRQGTEGIVLEERGQDDILDESNEPESPDSPVQKKKRAFKPKTKERGNKKKKSE